MADFIFSGPDICAYLDFILISAAFLEYRAGGLGAVSVPRLRRSLSILIAPDPPVAVKLSTPRYYALFISQKGD